MHFAAAAASCHSKAKKRNFKLAASCELLAAIHFKRQLLLAYVHLHRDTGKKRRRRSWANTQQVAAAAAAAAPEEDWDRSVGTCSCLMSSTVYGRQNSSSSSFFGGEAIRTIGKLLACIEALENSLSCNSA